MDGWIYEGINGWSTESIDLNIVDASMLIRQPGSALLISWGHGHRQRFFLQKKTVQNPRGCGNFNMLGKCTRSKAWQSFARKMQGFFPRYENHSRMSYISMLHIYIYIYLACWSFRWGEIWVEVHSKNHPCVAWTSCGPCGSQSKLQSCGCLRYLRWEEVILCETMFVCLCYGCYGFMVVLLMTKWSCKLSSGKNSLQVYRLLWRLSECITQFGKFLGIPNVTLPAPDLKTLAM